MPFTVSHTIVALPFRGTRVPAAALAVGAMAPDAVLFVPELPAYGVTHSALGALTVSTPVALIALAAWTFGLRWAFTAIQPRSVHDRLPASWDDPTSAWSAFRSRTPAARVGRLALVLATVIAGVYSHVAWDSFTHRHGWSVARIAVLRASIHGHAVYDLVQNACSVGGMLVLAVAFVLWLRRTPTVPRPRRLPAGVARGLRVALLAVAGLVTIVGAAPLLLVGSSAEGVLGWAAILAVRVCAVLLVLTAVGLTLVRVGRAPDRVVPRGR
ncbi:DUF4184 family protein [Curtobacterium sp. MCBD17_035]|uniref:DUF4184 family protein n=1 Tax=Curtobacterium sp. MCBD17_035 TaxID=2175673 RepID=UPI000DAA3864|nr:DUF4184 family protein [Curtobacterium sp. MCBD17_035]WIB67658.1 DUF4184 family protein [Curtobacterium sp. MCBD17_035]